jgi:hypothetical protein
MLFRKRFFGALLALLCGCSAIGHEKVEGWPQLTIVEHYVPHKIMRDRCMAYVSFGASPEACAEFDFASKVCHLWFSADFPPPPYIVEHEREHCQGYEHAGAHQLRTILRRHEALLAGGSRAAQLANH